MYVIPQGRDTAYFDKIKTKAEFLADAAHAVSGENAELLLFRAEEGVEGRLSYFRSRTTAICS